jgi:hypothetical protein
LQAESARAEAKHIATSHVNFVPGVWFFMLFLCVAAGDLVSGAQRVRGGSLRSWCLSKRLL